MKRKVYVLAVFVLLIAGILAGCGAGSSKEEVHLIVKTPILPMEYGDEIQESYDLLKKALDEFAAQYEEAEITYDLVKFAYTDEEEYITDTFDTESAPDILFEGYFNMASYIHTGRVVPLDDVITDELKNDIDMMSWTQSQVEGKTYMMPYYTLQNTLAYNKNLFKDAGLFAYCSEEETIQSWTLEEWEEILATLKDKLPELSYPMMMYAKNNQGDTHIMVLLRSHGSSFFDEEHNFNLNTEEGIEALRWIKDCYDAGYFPTGAENMEISENSLLRDNNQLAVFQINNSRRNPDWGYVNFPSADGKGYATSFLSGFEVFDNGDEKKIQAAKDFLRFFYSNDELMDVSACGLPVSAKVMDRHMDDVYMLEAYQKNAENVVDFTENNPDWTTIRGEFYTHIYDLLTGVRTPEQVAADIDAECNAILEEGRKSSVLHE